MLCVLYTIGYGADGIQCGYHRLMPNPSRALLASATQSESNTALSFWLGLSAEEINHG